MKNKTTWYLIVEMNDGELRCIQEFMSSGTARSWYKDFVKMLTTCVGYYCYRMDRHGIHERILDLTAVKTIKLISVKNRGKE